MRASHPLLLVLFFALVAAATKDVASPGPRASLFARKGNGLESLVPHKGENRALLAASAVRVYLSLSSA